MQEGNGAGRGGKTNEQTRKNEYHAYVGVERVEESDSFANPFSAYSQCWELNRSSLQENNRIWWVIYYIGIIKKRNEHSR